MIRRLASGDYRLYSRTKDPVTGKRRVLGTFQTRGAARQHERALQESVERRWMVTSIAFGSACAFVGLGVGVYFLLNPELSADAPLGQGDRQVGNPRLLVGIAALSTVFVAGALGYTALHGYVYCGRTAWVTREEHPRLFWTWFSIHLALAAGMGLVSFTMYRAL